MAIAIIPTIPAQDATALLMPRNPNKDEKSRISLFTAWLEETGTPWHAPDLAAYSGELAKRCKGSTITAHLGTIRGRYNRMLTDNAARQALYDALPDALSIADRAAFVNEVITRIENATAPQAVQVKVEKIQDRTDAKHLRLTKAQANALLAAPGTGTPLALRDTAMIALMLCTGIREAELVNLEVCDLRQRLNGELALHVRHGKGNKTRLIPYGALSWALAITEKWLKLAGIESGPVFCAFWKGGRRIREGRLTTKSVQKALKRYPVAIEGQPVRVKPHDLRRTYARRLYEAQMDVVAIQQNLGHSDLKTTLLYIGALDAEKRRAPAVYDFDLSSL